MVMPISAAGNERASLFVRLFSKDYRHGSGGGAVTSSSSRLHGGHGPMML